MSAHTPGPLAAIRDVRYLVEAARNAVSVLDSMREEDGYEVPAWLKQMRGVLKATRNGAAIVAASDAAGDLLQACVDADTLLTQIGEEACSMLREPLRAAIAKARGK